MLIDEIRIKIKSGKGGRGSEATFANKFTGGDGGDGGDVYFIGDRNLVDLGKFDSDEVYKAQNGGDGQNLNKHGAKGSDLLLKLPLTTEIFSDNQLLATINTDKQIYKILDGGKGLLGNVTLKRKLHKYHDPAKMLADSEPKQLTVRLSLKLKSDVIFIGYPNAGKSSLLNALTNTNVKTAVYEFTTLEPQRGMLNNIILMDLPGLIDGASLGKGLGTRFVKHTEHSKLLAHFVSLENTDPLNTYFKMRKEISDIGTPLSDMPELVILTKTDILDSHQIDKITKQFKDKNINTVSCSIIDDLALEQLKQIIISKIN